MTRFQLCSLCFVCFLCSVVSASAQQPNSLQSLKQYIGQMPLELLNQEAKINERLTKLLGKEFNNMKDRLNNNPTPIQLVGDVLILQGEKTFSVGNPKAIIGIGLSANKIHCALMDHNSRSIFSEEPQKIPKEFNSYMVKKDISEGKKKNPKKEDPPAQQEKQ